VRGDAGSGVRANVGTPSASAKEKVFSIGIKTTAYLPEIHNQIVDAVVLLPRSRPANETYLSPSSLRSICAPFAARHNIFKRAIDAALGGW